MTAWVLMYLFVIADQVREAVSGYGGAFAIACGATVVYGLFFVFSRMSIDIDTRSLEEFDERWEQVKKGGFAKAGRRALYLIWLIPFLMFFIHTALPTQKNLAILVGAGVTYEAVTSDSGKRIGGKIIQLLEEKLDEAAKPSDHEKGDKEVIRDPKEEVKKPEIQHAT